MKQWKDKETLEELYVDQNKTLKECAQELGCSHSTIARWLKSHDIPTRSPYESQMMHGPAPEPASFYTRQDGYEKSTHTYDGEVLEFYIHRLAAIAWFGVDSVEGKEVHHKNGYRYDNREDNIELLSSTDHMRDHLLELNTGEDGEAPWRDERVLRELYWEEEKTMAEMADELDVNEKTVWKWMKRHGIETRRGVDYLND